MNPYYSNGGLSLYHGDCRTVLPATGGEFSAVKPLTLMRWLVRLVAAGGPVLDPFAGSGTTLMACRAEGVPATGVELDRDHCKIAADRMSAAE